jgi:glycosyltransferase involved in cell wall biosynthesis
LLSEQDSGTVGFLVDSSPPSAGDASVNPLIAAATPATEPGGGARTAPGLGSDPPAAPSRRVLVLSPQPFYEDRGTPIALRQLLEALSSLAYEVDVVVYPVGAPLDIPGVRFHRGRNPLGIRHVRVGLSLRKLVLNAGLVPVLRQRLREADYLCIHALEEGAFLAALLGSRRKVPIVYDMASSLPEQLRAHRGFRNRVAQAVLVGCERWLLRRADFVVSSAGLLDRIRRLAPDTRTREWRFSGFDRDAAPGEAETLRADLGIPPGARIVLYAGTFERYQGLELLLQAMPRVLQRVPEAVFVLVGARGGDRSAVVRAVAPWLGGGKLHVIRRQPRERIPAFLAIADVLVSPRAYGDNLPLKIFDYLFAGRPIVATDIPAHRSVLTPATAELVPVSAPALTAGITRVLQDPHHAARIARAGREYAATHLGTASFVRSVALLYDEVRAVSGPVAAGR